MRRCRAGQAVQGETPRQSNAGGARFPRIVRRASASLPQLMGMRGRLCGGYRRLFREAGCAGALGGRRALPRRLDEIGTDLMRRQLCTRDLTCRHRRSSGHGRHRTRAERPRAGTARGAYRKQWEQQRRELRRSHSRDDWLNG
jgi:hypothetical protein